MRLLILLVLCCVFHEITKAEECDANNIGVLAYKHNAWVKKPVNGPYINITTLQNVNKIVIIVHQKIPFLCKQLTKRLQGTKLLFIAHSRIARIEKRAFSQMKNLSSLDLSKNNLEHISGTVFSNLQSLVLLDLSSNAISLIESNAFDNNPQLEELNLSENKIKSINNKWFTNCPKLKKIILRHNKLIQVPYLAFLNLNPDIAISIDLSANKIEKIANGAFANILKFDKLELQRNNIVEAPDFSELRTGRILNMKSNRIKCISKPILYTLKPFEKIRLKGNQLQSNCSILNASYLRSLKVNITFN